MSFQLTHTKIQVEGSEGDIIFSHLVINQYLADVNAFTFTWRQPEKKAALSDHVKFYKNNLSKVVTISIKDGIKFKGIINSISCNNQDALGVSYDIQGKGLLMKLDGVPECKAFFKKKLDKIFEEVLGTKKNISSTDKEELFYTVQYNQTRFQFLRMMAARYGEWFYYNGEEMVLGKPADAAISLTQHKDVHDIDITARLVKAAHNSAGYDHYKGETIKDEKKEKSKGGSFMEASVNLSESTFNSEHTKANVSNAPTSELLKSMNKLKQQAAAASTVYVTGRSYNAKLKLASKIKILEPDGKGDMGEYIITEIHHNCFTDNNYQNQFVAIPVEVEVPPYTNPELFAICKAQPAIVTDNEDKDGLDRIKVRFHWMQPDESTPWIYVLTPHAGKDKGIRFLPEIKEDVIIGFGDNNAERPYMMGAIHTEKAKSGNDHKSNFKKTIGTKTGRRIEIDDDEGFVKFVDNYPDKKPINIIQHQRKDSKIFLAMQSQKNDNDYSLIHLENGDRIGVQLYHGGQKVTEIVMEASAKKLTIKSMDTIEINAEKEINMKSQTINIKASKELNLEGSASGVNIKGNKVSAQAQTTMEVKGLTATVEGSTKLDLKGGVMASLTAGIVKIN